MVLPKIAMVLSEVACFGAMYAFTVTGNVSAVLMAGFVLVYLISKREEWTSTSKPVREA